jgi:uncharacterized protein YjiS (DUF1127 family)
MAVIDTFDLVRTETAVRTGNPFAALANFARSFADRRREHRLVARLSRLPDHVVRDMGFDPEKIARELSGTWDDVDLTWPARR